jgi:predicted lipoprotein with Yx(FWY)xxD motif
MKTKTNLMLFLVALFMAAVWGCAMTTTIQLKDKIGSGQYLTDANGMSLYYFKKDAVGKSNCSGDCLKRWPLFYTENVAVPQGLNEKDFGVITRDEGQKQTTYKGWPLYYFFKDQKAGDMNGEGVNNVWYVIYPDKFAP